MVKAMVIAIVKTIVTAMVIAAVRERENSRNALMLDITSIL